MSVVETKEQEELPISVAKAVDAAKRYAASIFEDAREFTLEEVELSDDKRFWMITLGYARKKIIPEERNPFLPPVLGPAPARYDLVYKVLPSTHEREKWFQ